ncbi:helix-turn-helix domain-containing protein [Celeribacter sp.]|uniref:helix-turn-helix domain-containing protein n=1 Tax=Celeribacter sp. TaxID=1890673 RepID=UPI003A8EB834
MADQKKERDPFAEAKDAYLKGLVRDGKLGEAAVKIAVELTIGFANRLEFEATGALVAWPSMRTLSEETGLFKSRIERAIKLLEETGHIVVDRPEKRGATHHNRYTLKIQNVRTGADNKKPKKVRTGADALSAPIGTKTLEKPLELGAGAQTRHAPEEHHGVLHRADDVSETQAHDVIEEDATTYESVIHGHEARDAASATVHLSPSSASASPSAADKEHHRQIMGEEWEPDHTPVPDPTLSIPDDLPPTCPDEDVLGDAVPEELWGCDLDDDQWDWDYHEEAESFAAACDEAISELEDVIGDWLLVDPIYLINSVVDGFTGARSRPSAYTAVDVLRDTFTGRGEEARQPWSEVQRILRELLILKTDSHEKGREAVEALAAALAEEQKHQARRRAAEQSREFGNG